MSSDNHGDGWDTFDWQSWGGGEPSANGHAANGHQPSAGDDGRRTELDQEDAEEDVRPRGAWVSQGGVMRWETPDDEESAPSLQDEARSPFAADDFALPAGAPDAARVRAVRAWLARQRQLAGEAIGFLLVERRQLQSAETGHDAPGRPEADESDNPLELALVEHQGLMEEYERLIEALDEILTHSGPARALIEYHLWLTERLAALAREPEAPAAFTAQLLLAEVEDEEQSSPQPLPTTPRSHAEWEGRAEAVVRTRRRVEWVTTPETEE